MEITILAIVLVNTLGLLLLGWWMMRQESERESYYLEYVPEEYLENFPTVAGQCDADCNPPAKRGGQIWCNPTAACTAQGGSCKCNLWRKLKGDVDSEWDKQGRGKKTYEPKKYFYRCWCTT